MAATNHNGGRVTSEEIARYLKLEADRRALDRQSRILKMEAGPLADRIMSDLLNSKKNSVKRGHYLVRLVDGRTNVSWKQEFVKLAGAEHASMIQECAPRAQKFEIDRLGQ